MGFVAEVKVSEKQTGFSQVELVGAILVELGRQGLEALSPSLTNAVIRAADEVLAAASAPRVPARPGMGLAAWLACDGTGLSSTALAYRLCPAGLWPYGARPPKDPAARPHDPADFGRCVAMLDAEPGLRANLASAAAISPAWEALVGAWDELEALYRGESPSGRCPRLYSRMRELTEGGRPR